MQDEIPPALLAKHPELVAVGEALEQIRDGKAVTARCVKCDKPLIAEEVEADSAEQKKAPHFAGLCRGATQI